MHIQEPPMDSHKEYSCASLAEDQERCYSGAVLNLVEAFEYKDNRDGTIKVKDESGNYIMYSRPEDAFANKDARLWGTVLYPGAKFRGSEVVLQAGQKVPDGNGNWKEIIGKADSYDDNNRLITSINGPMESNEIRINKTGFFFPQIPGRNHRCFYQFEDEYHVVSSFPYFRSIYDSL